MQIKWYVENLKCDLKATVISLEEGKLQKASLVVDKKDFIIKEAVGAYSENNLLDFNNVHKFVFLREDTFPELTGVLGYIQGKKIIKKRLLENDHANYVDVFIQCVSALLQAETYVYKERGYKSKEEYNVYWDFLEKNNCRMYSDSRREERVVDLPWMDYVPDNFYEEILFQREKTYSFEKQNGTIVCRGHLSDTYHEMDTLMEVDENGVVTRNEIKVIKAPGISCFTNDENNNILVGRKLNEIKKGDIICSLGGCDGCYHIVEMYIESHKLLTEKGQMCNFLGNVKS